MAKWFGDIELSGLFTYRQSTSPKVLRQITNIFLAFRQFNRAFQTESMEGYFTIYFSKKLIIIGNNLPAHCPDCVPEQIKVKKGFNNVQNFPLNT